MGEKGIKKLVSGYLKENRTEKEKLEYEQFFDYAQTKESHIYTKSEAGKLKKESWVRLSNTVGSNKINSPLWKTTLKIAASVLLLIGAGLLLKNKTSLVTSESELVEAVFSMQTIVLEDGTQVILKKGSTLNYPMHFAESFREVYVEGEAYFEVSKDANRPFLVHSGEVTTKVLGTHFNISNITKEEVKVSLLEGSVQLISGTKSTILKPMHTGVYSVSNNGFKVSKIQGDEVINWTKISLSVNNEPLKNVANKLAQQYGITISFQDAEIASYRLTGHFEKSTINEVMNTISSIHGVSYEMLNQEIRIKNQE